LKKVIYGFKD